MLPPEIESKKLEPSELEDVRRGWKGATRSLRIPPGPEAWFYYAYLVSIVIQLLQIGVLIFEPMWHEGFTGPVLKDVLVKLGFFCGIFGLGVFYDRTPVERLTWLRRGIVDLLLCAGGVSYLASFVMASLENWFATAVALIISVGLLALAKACKHGAHGESDRARVAR